MSEAEFWATTPRFFDARVRGHFKNVQSQYNVARFNAFFSVLPYDSKKKIKKPSDIWPFEWDTDKPVKLEWDADALERAKRLGANKEKQLSNGNNSRS